MLEPHRFTRKACYTAAEIDAYEKIRGRQSSARFLTWTTLGAVLVILKIAGVLDLSWWWTTAPITAGATQFFAAALNVATLRTQNGHTKP